MNGSCRAGNSGDIYDTEYALRAASTCSNNQTGGQRPRRADDRDRGAGGGQVSDSAKSRHTSGIAQPAHHESLSGALPIGFGGRDAVIGLLAYCKKMFGWPEKSRGLKLRRLADAS